MNFTQEYRCPNDNKLLFKGVIIESDIEVKCKHCHEIITFHGVARDALLCKKIGCHNRIQ